MNKCEKCKVNYKPHPPTQIFDADRFCGPLCHTLFEREYEINPHSYAFKAMAG